MVLTYSTTKGATAMCANRLAEQGLLDVDAPVVRVLAGVRPVRQGCRPRSATSWPTGPDLPGSTERCRSTRRLAWDPVVEALARQSPAWEPGTDHGYHAGHLRLPGGGGGAPDHRTDARHLLP